MNDKLKMTASKRGGYIPVVLDFILPIFWIIPMFLIIIFELILGFLIGFGTVIIDIFFLLIFLIVEVIIIYRFYFSEIGKIEQSIECFILSILNACSLLTIYVASSMIYSFITDENNFYVVPTDSILSDIFTGLIFYILAHSILFLFPFFRKITFETFGVFLIGLLGIILLIDTFTTENWQAVSITYTLAILLLSKDNINLFTAKKIDAERYKEKVEEIINSIKVLVGIIPLSLYGGISISEKYPFQLFPKGEIFSHLTEQSIEEL